MCLSHRHRPRYVWHRGRIYLYALCVGDADQSLLKVKTFCLAMSCSKNGLTDRPTSRHSSWGCGLRWTFAASMAVINERTGMFPDDWKLPKSPLISVDFRTRYDRNRIIRLGLSAFVSCYILVKPWGHIAPNGNANSNIHKMLIRRCCYIAHKIMRPTLKAQFAKDKN